MKRPAVTVLMPAHNAGRFIASAIRSVLDQTFGAFELLIINDASTDDTEEVIAQFKDNRIRVLTNAENSGIAKTLNRGIRQARGIYIARLDADDLCYPTRLAEQVMVMEQDSSVGMVASWTEVIDERGRTKGFGNWYLSPEAIYYVLHFRQCLTHSSVMFRAELARGLGGYPETVRAEDLDLWHRFAKVSKIVQLRRVLVKWRQHSSSITGAGMDAVAHSALELAQNYIRDVTGESYPLGVVKCFVECQHLSLIDPMFLIDFPAQLRKVQEGIAITAPKSCDQDRLRAYMQIEAAKYLHIFRSLRQPYPLALPVGAKALGLFFYVTRYRGYRIAERWLPKSHF